MDEYFARHHQGLPSDAIPSHQQCPSIFRHHYEVSVHNKIRLQLALMLTFYVRIVNTGGSFGQLGHQVLGFLPERVMGSVGLVVSPALLNTL